MRNVSSASSCVVTTLPITMLPRLQAVEQAAQQRGLARTDLAGDDDKAVVAQHAVVQIGLGAPVLLAAEIEIPGSGLSWNGCSSDRKGFVHGGQNCWVMLAVTEFSCRRTHPGSDYDAVQAPERWRAPQLDRPSRHALLVVNWLTPCPRLLDRLAVRLSELEGVSFARR